MLRILFARGIDYSGYKDVKVDPVGRAWLEFEMLPAAEDLRRAGLYDDVIFHYRLTGMRGTAIGTCDVGAAMVTIMGDELIISSSDYENLLDAITVVRSKITYFHEELARNYPMNSTVYVLHYH